MLHPPVKRAIVGLAPQHARLLIVGKIGEGGVDVRLGGVGVREEAVQERGKRGGGERCHEDIRSRVERVFSWR